MKKVFFSMLIMLLIPITHSCEEDKENDIIQTVTDFDGNVYKTVQIGNQRWMAENLRTTHYADGTPIPLVINETDWADLHYFDIAMSYYENSAINKETYGALYTWAAAMNGSNSSMSNPSGVQGLCMDGWHLPSDDEYKELEMYLGMSQAEADRYNFRGTNEGSKLAGDANLWNDGILITNSAFGTSGFMALPAGYRHADNGGFYQLHELGVFWTATESGDTLSISRLLIPHNTEAHRFTYSKKDGYSVRCIQD